MAPVYRFVLGDITTLQVDAIVNATHVKLKPTGGVDAAIHAAAGPLLLLELLKFEGIDVGDARLTRGYKLPAKFVIHTVGPQWMLQDDKEKALLSQCYRRCLEIAIREEIHSLAFPAISTGASGFPKALAAEIAVDTILRYSKKLALIQEYVFVCFDQETLDCYADAFEKYKVEKLMKKNRKKEEARQKK